MLLGAKVIIKAYTDESLLGQQGVIAGVAPDGNDTEVYKVCVGGEILPGWFHDADLEPVPLPYDVLIFDLDGTLTDSGRGIMRCAQYALQQKGIEVEDLNELRPFVGPPLEDSFKMFYGFSDEEARLAVENYRHRYFKLGIYEQNLYSGIDEVLRQLQVRGYRMAIGTSKMMRQALFVLDMLHIRQYFEAVGARDDEGRLHTKADVLNDLLARMNIADSKSSCIMIGDRKYDIEGANAVGLPSIGVLWGYGDEPELQAAGATHIVKDYDELLKLL